MDSEEQIKGGRDRQKSVLLLTQDEVILCQLCISDLLVQSAAWVEIHISHEAAAVEFLFDLPY